MAANTVIGNLALSHLGVGKVIGNLTTETSSEADTLRTFYDLALDATLRDFNWGFATKTVELGLLTDSEDDDHPTDEWTYAYTYPSDCLKARRILSGSRSDTPDSEVKYVIVHGESSSVIYTDQEDAVLEYTGRITDGNRYPQDFILTMSWRLALYSAARLVSGDPFGIRKICMEQYLYEGSKAEASNLNEQRPDNPPDPDLIRARN